MKTKMKSSELFTKLIIETQTTLAEEDKSYNIREDKFRLSVIRAIVNTFADNEKTEKDCDVMDEAVAEELVEEALRLISEKLK